MNCQEKFINQNLSGCKKTIVGTDVGIGPYKNYIFIYKLSRQIIVSKQNCPDEKPGQKLTVKSDRNGQNALGFACCFFHTSHHFVHLLSIKYNTKPSVPP